jgi:hypothetical protein
MRLRYEGPRLPEDELNDKEGEDEDEDEERTQFQIPCPTFGKSTPLKKLGKEMDSWFKQCLGKQTFT